MTKRKSTAAKAAAGSAAELAEMFPAPMPMTVRVKHTAGTGAARVITWEQHEVICEAYSVAELGAIASTLAPIQAAISETPNVLALALKHPEEIFAAVAQAIQWDIKSVRLMHGGDFVALVQRLVLANDDFFIRLLGPLVGALLATAAAAENGGLPKASASSADTATPIPKATH